MKKTKTIIWALLCIAAHFLISVFVIAKLISVRALQAAAAGVLAAILWFAFVRKINKGSKEQ